MCRSVKDSLSLHMVMVVLIMMTPGKPDLFVWAMHVTQAMCMVFIMLFLLTSAGSLLLCEIVLYAYRRSNFNRQKLHGDANQFSFRIKRLQAQL